jgi:hypothetical protein
MALPIRLRRKKARIALVKIVTALVTVPPAPDTEAKIGTLMFVVPSLIEFGILKLERSGEYRLVKIQ